MLPDLQATGTCVFSVVVYTVWSIRVCGVCVSCGVQLYVCVCACMCVGEGVRQETLAL